MKLNRIFLAIPNERQSKLDGLRLTKLGKIEMY